MRILPFEVLLNWILEEHRQRQSIFGIDRSLFHVPGPDRPYGIPDIFGHRLSTPIGPAAGPHTQLAQNIISAWLCGGRFIELKTVQVIDELDIPRPCMDMEDEGYNIEWSQELKLVESANEYIKAWALIHILHRLLGFEKDSPLGTIFNMSVGYTLDGIRSAPMSRFMDRMRDASPELAVIRAVLQARFPQFEDLEIPSQIANSVTLSTMHGCPPGEIEQIARYLLEERDLHTAVKLNPTLLGKETAAAILHGHLGFHEVKIPDAVFEKDLRYGQAVELIRSLQRLAVRCRLTFGVKLSNTLPTLNHKKNLAGDEMYLSGRALYPLTIHLFHKLAEEFHGDLNVSYSGGADAFNVSRILAAGARPVTVVTDLLKPGGYARLLQYLETLEAAMRAQGAASLDDLARNKLANLSQAAADALEDPRYKRQWYSHGLPKVDSGLALFDCIAAPCVERCAVRQDVPEYARWIARGEYDRALESIMAQNPLPGATGYVCTQLCQMCCTRSASNYDEPVAIRALKRFAAERGRITLPVKDGLGRRVAIVGGGPSGLSAAYFLALNGIQVTVFEAKDHAGGMMLLAPAFRLPSEVIQADVDRIVRLGVELRLSRPVARPPEDLLRHGFDAVYVASGFQKNAPLRIEGIQARGVIAALDLLQQARRGERIELGSTVVVIGGGNTAMDAARVARRLTGHQVLVVYRRTREDMPAGDEDIESALQEGIRLQELVSPVRVILRGDRVAALECMRNRRGERGTDGRRQPVPLPGSEFRIEADSIVVAVGQIPDLAFLRGSAVRLRSSGSIVVDPETGSAGARRVYAGGDAARGPGSIIAACEDGRRAAEAICAEFGIDFRPLPAPTAELSEAEISGLRRARARREIRQHSPLIPLERRGSFELVEATLAEGAARREAARCLQCSSHCDKCVDVCPNRANQAYVIPPEDLKLPVLSCRNGLPAVTGETVFRVGQTRQIVHLHDLCNDCGNCATFCVHRGQPYLQKPRLFFRASEFAGEHDNAFYLEKIIGGWTIRRRDGGRESALTWRGGSGEVTFENHLVKAVLASADFRVKSVELNNPFSGELALVEPAEMYVIVKGLTASTGFLPFGLAEGAWELP
ncbi:MAG: putative selenate reductase subunit YgfK [Acidobacteriota bacterium]